MRLPSLVLSGILAAMPGSVALAQISLGFNTPGLSIGVNIPVYPDFVLVPDFPVYYAPRLATNLFYYDGMYWLLVNDDWYVSTWYNGPWQLVEPQSVPLYVLRVPVRYYRRPPAYFHSWRADAAPRWDEHWGPGWSQGHPGWDKWNRRDAPRPAPLPQYQRQYSGNRYPQAEQQQLIRQQHDKYQPRDEIVRQRLPSQPVQTAPAPARQGPGAQQSNQQRPQQAPLQQAPQREQRQQQVPHEQQQRQPPPQQPPQQRQAPQEQRQKQQNEPGHERQQIPQQGPQRDQQPQPQQVQQQAQQHQAQQQQQEKQHAAARQPERATAPAREPAKEARKAPEKDKDRDKADHDQGSQENRK